jgi:hypothetical protein
VQAVEDPKDKDIEFTNRGSNSTNFINKSFLEKLVFQAKKEGKSELPVPNISYQVPCFPLPPIAIPVLCSHCPVPIYQ